MSRLRFNAAHLTHPGRVREANEDSLGAFTSDLFWIVADGMGGHSSGQVASQMAVEHISDFMVRWRRETDFIWPFDTALAHGYPQKCLVNAIRVANVRIYNRAQIDETCESMGTTVVMAHFDETSGMVVAHVGDSRCYRWRSHQLTQLTDDHSLAREMSRIMDLTEADAQAQVGSHIILRALGTDDDVEVDVLVDEPRSGDVYLLCSDGLTDMIDDAFIAQIMGGAAINPTTAVEALIGAANEAGGLDNISALIVAVSED